MKSRAWVSLLCGCVVLAACEQARDERPAPASAGETVSVSPPPPSAAEPPVAPSAAEVSPPASAPSEESGGTSEASGEPSPPPIEPAEPSADLAEGPPSDPMAPAPELLARARAAPASSADAYFHVGPPANPRGPGTMLMQVASRWMRLWQLDVHEGVEVRHDPRSWSRWMLTVRASRERAEALAEILGVGAAELAEEPGERVEPRPLRVREATGVRVEPTAYNVSTVPRGMIVLGLIGTPRHSGIGPPPISALEPGAHVFVAFAATAGWIPADRLEPYEGCLPVLGPLLSERQRADRYRYLPSATAIVAEEDGVPSRMIVQVKSNSAVLVGVLDVSAVEGRACHLRAAPIVRAEPATDVCRAEVVGTSPPLLVTEWDRFCDGNFDYLSDTGVRTTRVYPIGSTDLVLELVAPTHPALGPRRRTALRWNVRAERGAPRIPLEVRPPDGPPQRYVFEGERLVAQPPSEVEPLPPGTR